MTTKTTTVVGDAPNFPVVDGGGGIGFSIGLTATAVVAGILYFRRKLSRDSTEIIKDRADGKFTQQLMESLEARSAEAKEAWAKFNELNAEVGELRAANAYLKREVDRLVGELAKAQDKLDSVRKDLWELRKSAPDSGHAPLS